MFLCLLKKSCRSDIQERGDGRACLISSLAGNRLRRYSYTELAQKRSLAAVWKSRPHSDISALIGCHTETSSEPDLASQQRRSFQFSELGKISNIFFVKTKYKHGDVSSLKYSLDIRLSDQETSFISS